MARKALPVTSCCVSGAFDRFRKDNPLIVRKKFEMKDVFFRKDHPETELFRAELAFDTQLYVLLVVLGIGMVWLFYKTVRGLEKRRVRSLEKAYLKAGRAD